MAQANLLLDKDQFNCPICLDVLKDPVTIPCGHSYCSGCIKGYWEDQYTGVVCPQCRQTFHPRPLLGRNTMLADVVERFMKTSIRSDNPPSPPGCVGPEDVECDVCTGRKSKAVKSCLVCLASYCDAHLQPHYDSTAFKKHKLVSATKKLQETICSEHDKLLEFYCRTDQKCICYLCLTTVEHKGHDTVLAETEIHEKQSQISQLQRSSQHRIQVREQEVQELRQAIVSLNRSARVAVEDSEKVFSELIRSMEVKRFEMRELIRVQEKTAVNQAEGLLARLEQEIAELRRRDSELELLSHTDDHIAFLQSCQSLGPSPGLGVLPAVTFDTNFTFVSVLTAVSEFRGLLEEVFQGGLLSIYEKVRDVSIITPDCRTPVTTKETTHPSAAQPNVPAETTHPNTCQQVPPMEVQGTANLNPFLSPGGLAGPSIDLTGPSNGLAGPSNGLAGPSNGFGGFTFSTPGGGLRSPNSKLSGPRHRLTQRRSQSRRK